MKSVFEQQYADSFTQPVENERTFFDAQIAAAQSEFASGDSGQSVRHEFSLPHSFTMPSDKGPTGWDVPSRLSRLSTFLPEQFVSGKRWVGWLISFVAGILIGALVIFLIMSALPPKIVEKEKVITKTEIVYRDAPLSASAASEAETGTATDRRQQGVKGNRQSRKSRGAEREDRKRELLANLNVSGRSGAGSSGSESATGLSAAQLNSVVASHRSGLQQCYERALKSGNASSYSDLKTTFTVDVGKSGTVTSVRITGAGAKVPSLKSCFDGVVHKWVFPAATRSSSVQFPIVFTPSR